jgi:hypothetical protein
LKQAYRTKNDKYLDVVVFSGVGTTDRVDGRAGSSTTGRSS